MCNCMTFLNVHISNIVKMKVLNTHTCVTIRSHPPRFAAKTGSIQYVARVVFTVVRTEFITFTAIKSASSTTFFVPN